MDDAGIAARGEIEPIRWRHPGFRCLLHACSRGPSRVRSPDHAGSWPSRRRPTPALLRTRLTFDSIVVHERAAGQPRKRCRFANPASPVSCRGWIVTVVTSGGTRSMVTGSRVSATATLPAVSRTDSRRKTRAASSRGSATSNCPWAKFCRSGPLPACSGRLFDSGSVLMGAHGPSLALGPLEDDRASAARLRSRRGPGQDQGVGTVRVLRRGVQPGQGRGGVQLEPHLRHVAGCGGGLPMPARLLTTMQNPCGTPSRARLTVTCTRCAGVPRPSETG